jgi:hypothetical protein
MPSATASGAEFRGSKTPRIVAIIRGLVDPETGDHAFGEADLTFVLARMHRSKANQLPKTLPAWIEQLSLPVLTE